MPGNNYYINNSSAMLHLKPPVKVRNDLNPTFLRHRIPEILGLEYLNICRDFYNSIYHYFCSNLGYPIKRVFPRETDHTTLEVGDVISLEEVGNYSRLYQKNKTNIGFLIIEQSLDTTSNPELNIWKTIIKNYPQKLEAYQKNTNNEGVLKLQDFKKEDEHVYNHFKLFLDTHNKLFAEYLINNLPDDKAHVICEYNPDPSGMINALWEDFLVTQLN